MQVIIVLMKHSLPLLPIPILSFAQLYLMEKAAHVEQESVINWSALKELIVHLAQKLQLSALLVLIMM
jgi:hypothetical protein